MGPGIWPGAGRQAPGRGDAQDQQGQLRRRAQEAAGQGRVQEQAVGAVGHVAPGLIVGQQGRVDGCPAEVHGLRTVAQQGAPARRQVARRRIAVRSAGQVPQGQHAPLPESHAGAGAVALWVKGGGQAVQQRQAGKGREGAAVESDEEGGAQEGRGHKAERQGATPARRLDLGCRDETQQPETSRQTQQGTAAGAQKERCPAGAHRGQPGGQLSGRRPSRFATRRPPGLRRSQGREGQGQHQMGRQHGAGAGRAHHARDDVALPGQRVQALGLGQGVQAGGQGAQAQEACQPQVAAGPRGHGCGAPGKGGDGQGGRQPLSPRLAAQQAGPGSHAEDRRRQLSGQAEGQGPGQAARPGGRRGCRVGHRILALALAGVLTRVQAGSCCQRLGAIQIATDTPPSVPQRQGDGHERAQPQPAQQARLVAFEDPAGEDGEVERDRQQGDSGGRLGPAAGGGGGWADLASAGGGMVAEIVTGTVTFGGGWSGDQIKPLVRASTTGG